MVNSVSAATWIIEPIVSVAETYCDNITLSDENKSSDFVSQINPGFSIIAKGRRIQLSGQYSLGYINYWDDTYSDRYYNQGRLNANVELVKKHLDFDAAVSVSEQVIDPTKITAFDSQAITDNRTETQTMILAPTLRNRFSRYANSLLTYQHSRVAYSTKQIDSSYDNKIKYSLSSGRWFKRLAWDGNVSSESGQQKNANKIQINGRLDYFALRQWKLFVTGHIQKRAYISTQENNSRYFVKNEIGLAWTPSRKVYFELGGGVVLNSQALGQSRLDVEQEIWRAKVVVNPTRRTIFEIGREQAIYGRRMYSSFKHYTKKTIWSSTYAETLITPQQSRYTAELSGELEIENGESEIESNELNRLVTNDVLLRKRLDFIGKVNRRKVSLTGRVFYEKGEYQTIDQTDERFGVNGGVEINLSRKLSGLANVVLQKYKFNEQSQMDNIYLLNTGLSRKINKKTNASLIYIWQMRSVNSSGANYSSNKLVANIILDL